MKKKKMMDEQRTDMMMIPSQLPLHDESQSTLSQSARERHLMLENAELIVRFSGYRYYLFHFILINLKKLNPCSSQVRSTQEAQRDEEVR